MSVDNGLERRIRHRLAALASDGLLRTLRPPEHVDLSSNDYLGLASHPTVVGQFRDTAAREGCGSSGSRLLRGHRELFEAVERRFAAFKGSERALLFGAGYLANIGILSALPEQGDIIFSDELNHASLIDGARLSRAEKIVFRHNDVEQLARLLAETPCAGLRFVAVESLFSMDGDFAPLEAYADICRSTGAALIVDEAHAVGVYGDRGSGLIEAAGVDEDVLISVNTGGKALGVAGAFVAGPGWVIEYLLQRARSFVFSTAPPPANAAALDASLTIVTDEPERRARVRARAALLRRRLADSAIAVSSGSSQIIPIIIGGNRRAMAIASAVQADGFDVRAIRPPSVAPGTARLRVSVNAGLSEADLNRFVDSLSRALHVHPDPSWSAASL
jgi:8-amino-7-oxononanoate synthase